MKVIGFYTEDEPNSDSDIRSRELATKNGGLAYFVTNLKSKKKSFWSFPCVSNCFKERASLEDR